MPYIPRSYQVSYILLIVQKAFMNISIVSGGCIGNIAMGRFSALALKVDVRLIHTQWEASEAKNRVMLCWNSLNWGHRNFTTRKNYKNFTRVLHLKNSTWSSHQSPAVLLQSRWFYGFPKFRYSPKILGTQPTVRNSIFVFFSVLDWFRLISGNLSVPLIFSPHFLYL